MIFANHFFLYVYRSRHNTKQSFAVAFNGLSHVQSYAMKFSTGL